MNFDKVANVLGALVGVAIITTLVAHKYTAGTVTALGNAFSGAVTSAEGGVVASTGAGTFGAVGPQG